MADEADCRRSLRPAAAAALRALGVQVLTDLDVGARRVSASQDRLIALARGGAR